MRRGVFERLDANSVRVGEQVRFCFGGLGIFLRDVSLGDLGICLFGSLSKFLKLNSRSKKFIKGFEIKFSSPRS